ncbi:hypothetical protein HK100_002837 [Physocladia obscura]|uniref:Xylanolytic transcriptional activator regulatory domain-containing protein n=1 Tax=Physocladia obscura TaxID=109957 RepID=A0AAD5SXR5_9FUNG|nr:hypothetical protein HK100_002837 [Physocladia obscura]
MQIEANDLQTQSSPASTNDMPNVANPEQLIEIFFQVCDFPKQFVHRKTLCKIESPLLFTAMCALGAKYSPQSSVRAAEGFFQKAMNIACLWTNVMTTSEIAGLILLHVYCAASEQISRSSKFLTMAVTYLKELCNTTNSYDFQITNNSLIPTVNKDSWLEREKLRRLWWACYILDRFSSAVSDKPKLVLDSGSQDEWTRGFQFYVDTTAQMKASKIINFLSPDAYNRPVDAELFDHHILLAKIVGRIKEVHANNNGLFGEFAGNPQTERDLKLLEMALQSWEKYIPADLYFTNTIPSNNVFFPATMLERVRLQISFRICTILLHKPKLLSLVRKQQQQQHQLPHSQSQQLFHDILTTVCFRSCYKAACEIKKLISDNRNLMHFMSSQTSFAMSESRVIHQIAREVLHSGGACAFGAKAVTPHYEWPGSAIFVNKSKLLQHAAEKTQVDAQYGSECGPSYRDFSSETEYSGISRLNSLQATGIADSFVSDDGVMTADEFLLQANTPFYMQPNVPFYIQLNVPFLNQQNSHNFFYKVPSYNSVQDNPSSLFPMNSENRSIQQFGFPGNNQENSSIVRENTGAYLARNMTIGNSRIDSINMGMGQTRSVGEAQVNTDFLSLENLLGAQNK